MTTEKAYDLVFTMPRDVEKRRFQCDAINLIDACEQMLQAYPGAHLLDGAVHSRKARGK